MSRYYNRRSTPPLVEWNLECLEVSEDMTRRYVSEFAQSVDSPEDYMSEERFEKHNLQDVAALASEQMQRTQDSRVKDGYALRLDERRVESAARVAGAYIVRNLFSDEFALVPRRPEPVLNGAYDGMGLYEFQQAVAVQYARDMVAAVEQGVTPDIMKRMQSAEAAT